MTAAWLYERCDKLQSLSVDLQQLKSKVINQKATSEDNILRIWTKKAKL